MQRLWKQKRRSVPTESAQSLGRPCDSKLENCLKELASDQRQLVERYYRKQEAIKAIAESLNRRANAVAVSLHRIRQALANCIRRTMT